MKNWNRMMGFGLSAALLLGTLTGCTTFGKGQPTATPSPTASAAVEEIPLVATEDSVQKVVGIPGDTVMFTVNGEGITAAELYYWIAASVERVGYYSYGSAAAIDWTATQDGKSISEFILEDAKQTATFYRLIKLEAAKAGIALSDTDRADLEGQIAAYIKDMGEEGYAARLQQICLSDGEFRQMLETGYLYTAVQNDLFGDKGKNPPTDKDLIAMADEEGLMRAKHILIKTVNMASDGTRTPLSDEEQAAAKAKAEGILAQLKATTGSAQAELFDKLMEENSEDGRGADGKLSAPDGYLFGTKEMVQEFEDATKALEYNQISDLVKTDYGYHIILRLPPVSDEMRDKWISAKMEETTNGWLAAAKVEDGAGMANIDVKTFYDALVAYRATLAPAEETPAPTSTTTPTPTPTATPAS